ncbi:hypothetical protein [Bartonella sp. DGB2]|uniref:cell division protein FtsL n=1 Tax=Bartonella sp. DGB2 TaxID=3388426 RepID=UPI00398FB811
MTVLRTFDIVLVGIMISTVAFTYKIKYDVQKRLSEAKHLEQQISSEQDTIHLLKTEWALLTAPKRMEILANRYHQQLGLELTTPQQIVALKDVPKRLSNQIGTLINHMQLEEGNTLLTQHEPFAPLPIPTERPQE